MNSDILKHNYPALSIISALFTVFGIIILIASIGGIIYGITLLNGYDTKEIGIIIIVACIVGGLLYALLFIGSAELIKVLVRIEFNTRSIDQRLVGIGSIASSNQSKSSETTNREYEEWKKSNPCKSINDFYARKS